MNTGYTYDPTPEQRARNKFVSCLHFLRLCEVPEDGKISARAEHWISRTMDAINDLRSYVSDEEIGQLFAVLFDIVTIDPAHRQYAEPDFAELRNMAYMLPTPEPTWECPYSLNDCTPEEQARWYNSLPEIEL